MKIGLMHFRSGFTDGVSLEMDKQKTVLEEMGHEVVFVCGELQSGEGIEIPLLHLLEPRNERLSRNGFGSLEDFTTEEYEEELNDLAYLIESQVTRVILEHQIEMLIVHNLFSLGLNLAAAKGLSRAIEKTEIRAMAHHHDFYWERAKFSRPTLSVVNRFLSSFFPPNSKNVTHGVINSLAQKELLRKRNLSSVIIPNVMDFNQPPWLLDEFNNDLRERLGIGANDLVFLQATRILPRKAIELAFEFIRVFYEEQFPKVQGGTRLYTDRKIDGKSALHFVLCGLTEEMDKEYLKEMKALARQMPYSCHFVPQLFSQRRNQDPKTYSLWDAYTLADIVTFPSVQEGWGNQLLEAVFAKKTVVGYEYPVFRSDILPKGLQIVSLGKNAQIGENGLYELDRLTYSQAAESLFNLITDYPESLRLVERNFSLGARHFSYEVLKKNLNLVLEGVEWE
ncbi:MAG TPA: glycosyltransferase family 4 protein [Thermotogota bacterium]|jgi:hypothetical protein|nr:glycosyltransferase family 4 protein [Thermotogota bacterium]NLH20320.1 glycosyltransferase family 4 protein [Thermotogaceae bacterium]OQC31568.1 MAG: Glycosyl transferases group 1 [Thermotogota bacterium ADurb.Bin062]HNW47393.1 glycosyltransferase family 4 protein [Thermotogota bacterium]HOD91148.1 glycosyltransferase family 4 protein [Thermotogota bacterium]